MRTPQPDAPTDEVGPELDTANDDADTEQSALFPMPLSTRERREAAGKDWLAALFDDEPHSTRRQMQSLAQVKRLSDELKRRGYKVCLTNGSFDILHVGHSMYLNQARAFGDFLIVGVDSDEKIRQRKGPGRPLVPEKERLRMLTYQRSVGAVFLKSVEHKQWKLIEKVRPHVLVVTEDTYSDETIEELEGKFKCKVQVLPRMAMISTSGQLRSAQMGTAEEKLFELEPGVDEA